MDKKSIQLSPNSLNLFLECPHCFWLEKKASVKRPPLYPYILNTAVDSLLREEFDTYRSKNLVHPLIKDLSEKSGKKIKAHLFSNQKLLNQWRNNLAGIRYFDPELNATLIGALDDVLEFEDGEIAPLDYKTTEKTAAKIYDRFQLQLDVYTFLMEKNGFATPRKGYLAFYIVDKSKGFIDRLPFRKELIEIETNPSDIYEIFKDAVKCLQNQTPPPHSHDCKFAKWIEGASPYQKN